MQVNLIYPLLGNSLLFSWAKAGFKFTNIQRSILNIHYIFRLFKHPLVEAENEKAWFPAAELKEFHGIVQHEVTAAETLLFCIKPDGSEGLCCPIYYNTDDFEELPEDG